MRPAANEVRGAQAIAKRLGGSREGRTDRVGVGIGVHVRVVIRVGFRVRVGIRCRVRAAIGIIPRVIAVLRRRAVRPEVRHVIAPRARCEVADARRREHEGRVAVEAVLDLPVEEAAAAFRRGPRGTVLVVVVPAVRRGADHLGCVTAARASGPAPRPSRPAAARPQHQRRPCSSSAAVWSSASAQRTTARPGAGDAARELGAPSAPA